MTTAYSYDSVGNLLTQATSGTSDIAFGYSYNKNEKVDDMLSAATNREEAIEILHEIADQLAEGTFFN